jgi:DNA (cytosine-5)-methyltransferase 1
VSGADADEQRWAEMTYQIPIDDDLIIDNFAGGGGASTGIEMALGRPVNIAINHDPEALGMHAANHLLTRHYCENVFAVDLVQLCAGRTVALA